MSIAYFDCFAGISGDMILGALVDAGLQWEQLQADLGKLPLAGYNLTKEIVTKNGIRGTKVRVNVEKDQKHRHLKDIQAIIYESTLPSEVKEKILDIFLRLAEVEARIHGTTIDKVHFHEVGALDAIVDIVGAVSGLWRLGITEVYASPLPVGGGFSSCDHGLIPVPAPATIELLKGVPVYANGIEKEIVTPTGAAILSSYCTQYGPMPLMQVDMIGYGAGDWELDIPNVLRICLGKTSKHSHCKTNGSSGSGKVHKGEAFIIEANIDDMNPEFYDYVMNKFIKAGAMDVFLRKIQMKKNRPGVTLCVLAHVHQVEEFCQLIFSETTSIGVRAYPVTKFMLHYDMVTVETQFGQVRVKVARHMDQVRNIAPEYEDCKSLAETQQVPLKEIYDEAKFLAYNKIKN